MPKHFVSRPVANSLQSGTFKKGGKVHKESGGGVRGTIANMQKDMARAYKDTDAAYKSMDSMDASRSGNEDLSKGAYDEATKQKPVGSGFAGKVQGAIDKFFNYKKPSSVTETKESVTVSPKKRGGKVC
jgi:hypothetical protein